MKKRLLSLIAGLYISLTAVIGAFAVDEDNTGVAKAVTDTWESGRGQVKSIVNRVVFPIVDVVLAVWLFIKIALTYHEYKKSHEMDFKEPAILLFCLLFSMTAPLYLWNVLGW